MKATFFLAGAVAAIQSIAQVTTVTPPVSAPTAPVTAPPSPVTAPTTIPNPLSTPGSLINPAVPTAVPPQTAGRTFQTPVMSGSPAPTSILQPNAPVATAPGFPPVGSGGFPAVGATNLGLSSPFDSRLSGAAGPVGGDPVGLGFPPPFATSVAPHTNFTQQPPVSVDLPPGTVVGTTRPSPVTRPNQVGTPFTPGVERPFPNTVGGAGRAPTLETGIGESRPPSVVRPQR